LSLLAEFLVRLLFAVDDAEKAQARVSAEAFRRAKREAEAIEKERGLK